MAQAMDELGADITFGDLIFGLGVPIPLRSLRSLERVARCIAPVVSQLPFSVLYPTGKKQEQVIPKYSAYYQEAEIIAGDFLFIRRHLPEKMQGQTIITNTVTTEDLAFLKNRGIKTLVTTTPELGGRSFGTNVMEGVLISILGKPPSEITPADYSRLLEQMDLKPRVVEL